MTQAEVERYTLGILNRCYNCYKKLDRVKSEVVDNIDYIVCEEKVICENCEAQVDYYAYGNSEAECERREFETNHPKAAELIRKMAGL